MNQAIVFGKYDHLVGVANIAQATTKKSTEQVAMILITAGMLHNVGPFRLYVDIANSLETQGISSLRFDISGIGESLGVGSSGKSIERAASEASEAMDYLSENHGIKKFVVFGLCSGADDSVQTALNDERVIGVITLDGLGYKTPKFARNQRLFLAKKILLFNNWKSKISSIAGLKPPPVSLAVGGDIREFPETAEQASKEIQQLVDRGTQLHFIYTGGTDYYNYAKQLYDMLPYVNWKGTESTRYFPHMDHVILLCEDRQEMVAEITTKTLKMAVRVKEVA